MDIIHLDPVQVIQKLFNETILERNKAYEENQVLNEKYQTLQIETDRLYKKYCNINADYLHEKQENIKKAIENEELKNEFIELQLEIMRKEEEVQCLTSKIEILKKTNEVNVGVIAGLTEDSDLLKVNLETNEIEMQILKETGEDEMRELCKKEELLQDHLERKEQCYQKLRIDFENACDELNAKNGELALSKKMVIKLQGRLHEMTKQIVAINNHVKIACDQRHSHGSIAELCPTRSKDMCQRARSDKCIKKSKKVRFQNELFEKRSLSGQSGNSINKRNNSVWTMNRGRNRVPLKVIEEGSS